MVYLTYKYAIILIWVEYYNNTIIAILKSWKLLLKWNDCNSMCITLIYIRGINKVYNL